MPLAYVSSPPDTDGLTETIDRLLFDAGWTPVMSPAMISEDIHAQAEKPSPQLVDYCLQSLRRTELLVSVGQWRRCELCRIEHNFAKENGILHAEANQRQLNIPDAETFGEKYMLVDIHHTYKHAHRRA